VAGGLGGQPLGSLVNQAKLSPVAGRPVPGQAGDLVRLHQAAPWPVSHLPVCGSGQIDIGRAADCGFVLTAAR
jgi:hypothetical protein